MVVCQGGTGYYGVKLGCLKLRRFPPQPIRSTTLVRSKLAGGVEMISGQARGLSTDTLRTRAT
jgi:hypothetical protein